MRTKSEGYLFVLTTESNYARITGLGVLEMRAPLVKPYVDQPEVKVMETALSRAETTVEKRFNYLSPSRTTLKHHRRR